jgi:hypothetical protein
MSKVSKNPFPLCSKIFCRLKNLFGERACVIKFFTIAFFTFQWNSSTLYWIYVTCHQIEMSLWEKQMRCCDCGSNILISMICPSYRFAFPLYVYVNLMIVVPNLLPSFSYALPHTHTLSLSVSLLASSLSPPFCFAYKPMANLFMLSLIAIKSCDKHRCFT